MNKILDYYNKLSMIDFIRKCVHFVGERIKIHYFLRKFKSAYYFKKFNVKLGRNVQVYGRTSNIKFGENVEIYSNAVFEFSHLARFSIGDNSLLSYNVLISCKKVIEIGKDVQIGEYTSLRDSTHEYNDKSKPMKYAKDKSAEIIIGNDVWIGRGCIIMPGTFIENGVVIGANSVVKGHLKTNCIYAGNPIKIIKNRFKK